MENIIEVKNLTKDYGHGRGIFDFSFGVKQGSVFGLVGTNGSGKTTNCHHEGSISEKVSCFFAPKIKYGTLRHLLFSF